MLEEIELDNKDIVDLINKSKEFFENVDENFYDGVQELIKVTYERLKEEGLFKIYKKYRYGELDNTMTSVDMKSYTIDIPDRKYVKPVNTPEETYNIVENFFCSLGKMYGESAHYFLRSTPAIVTDRALDDDDYIFRFAEIGDNILLEHASDEIYTLEGNYLDSIIIAHEIAHQLTSNPNSDMQINVDENDVQKNNDVNNSETVLENTENEKDSFLNMSSFYETTAMYIELMCADYIKEKIDFEEYAKWAMSIRGIELLKELENEDVRTKLSTLSKWIKLIKEIGTEQDDVEKVKNFIQKNKLTTLCNIAKEHMSSSLVLQYQHMLGYFYAIYLKRLNESNKEYSDKNAIFNKCIKINSFGKGFHTEEMEILKQLHLPIVRDDKFVMDENAIFKLSSSYFHYFRENLKSAPTKAKNVSNSTAHVDFAKYLKNMQYIRDAIKKEERKQNVKDDYER